MPPPLPSTSVHPCEATPWTQRACRTVLESSRWARSSFSYAAGRARGRKTSSASKRIFTIVGLLCLKIAGVLQISSGCRSHARHSRGSTQPNGRSHRAPSLDAPLITTTTSNCAPAVRASAQLHQCWKGVLEPLLTLRVCRGDAPHGGSRLRAQNPPLTAPFVRISLTGCSIDGEIWAYGSQL